MNIEKFKELRDFLKRLEDADRPYMFNMLATIHCDAPETGEFMRDGPAVNALERSGIGEDIERLGECGTVACLAGWTCYLEALGPSLEMGNSEDVMRRAACVLGLSRSERDYLFLGEWCTKTGSSFSLRSAIEELDAWIENGGLPGA